jgi:hypothetical protein
MPGVSNRTVWFYRACVFASLGASHLALAPIADACSFADPPFVLDPATVGIDQTAPTVVIDSITIREGRAPERSGCGTVSSTSCDDIGSIRVSIGEVSDDLTPVEAIGYRLIIEGDTGDTGIPVGDSQTLLAYPDGEVFVRFIDDDVYNEGEWDFTVRVVAVDQAGNESEPTPPIRLTQSAGGCSATGAAPLASTILPGALALLWLRRRRHAG